jgi:predicted secreted hydrolase
MFNISPQRPHCLLAAILLAMIIFVSTATAGNGYEAITGPCHLAFPSDHGPHPAYRTEWWYYTGNLTNAEGHRFGFQLTFFRSALQPSANRNKWPKPTSRWRTDQIYLAHAALTDIDNGRHLQAEQTARAALALAGAEQTDTTTTIHLNTWQAVIKPDIHHLSANTADFSFDLNLAPAKPPVAHGDRGYSRKGQTPEQSSCYYSFTRLEATGHLTVADRRYTARGTAWMDHEFSSAPLAPGIVGWDWFSIQLDNQQEIMLYMMRQADGTMDPASSGTVVLASGQTRHLNLEESGIQPLAYWISPVSGARYPVKWRVTIPSLALNLTVEANLEGQEMHTPNSTDVIYWEGSVRAKGAQGDATVSGVGYVELTGYAKPFDAPM